MIGEYSYTIVFILIAATKSKNEVECGVLLDGIVLKCVAVFKLFAGEDKSLLVWWDAFLILDLSFNIFDAVCWFDFECDVLACECLDEDLHTTTESKDKVECGILLYGIVLKCVAVFELLASEDESLLVWWDTFLVLDLGLDVFDSVCWFDFECDVLACECLHEDLH